ERTVDLRLHHQVVTLGQRPLDELARRAVQVAVVLEPFQKRARREPPFEFFPAQEEVVLTLGLARTGRPGRRRYRVPEAGQPFEQRVDQRVLAGPRGPGNHEEQTRSEHYPLL